MEYYSGKNPSEMHMKVTSSSPSFIAVDNIKQSVVISQQNLAALVKVENQKWGTEYIHKGPLLDGSPRLASFTERGYSICLKPTPNV